jgi:hypothetical protein
METKTRYITYLLLFVSIFLHILLNHLAPEFSILKPLENPQISQIIRNIYSICFLLASGLFIWRGIYYLRKQGFQKKFLFELLMGLFLSISITSMLYATKELGERTLQVLSGYKDKELTDKRELNDLIAQDTYIMEGRILKYNGTVYQPTEEDKKQRQQILEMHHNLSVMTQGVYNWIALIVISILLGLLLPVRKESLSKQWSQ